MNEFIGIIEELIQLFEELIHIEQTKLGHIKKDRITYLEACMKDEQAALMKLRGLDRRREASQVSLGYEHLTFREILLKVPVENKATLSWLFDTLTSKVHIFTEIRDSSRTLLEIKLHQIDQIMNDNTSPAADNRPLTSRKI